MAAWPKHHLGRSHGPSVPLPENGNSRIFQESEHEARRSQHHSDPERGPAGFAISSDFGTHVLATATTTEALHHPSELATSIQPT